MAANKKTFIFYSDWINIVQEMPDKDAGELLKHILLYVNDENPSTDNILVKMAFGHMKPLLKEDLQKWEVIREKRREAGKKGGKANAKQMLPNAKQAQAVNVNDNDNVNVNVNDIVNDNIYKPSFFSDEVENCFKECLKYFDEHLHPKDPKKWKEVIEKLNRIDKIPFEQITRITKKTREDLFWQTNFLSLTKLRQKQKSSGLYYIVVFNEQLKSKSNDTRTNQEIAADAINSETAKNFRFS